MLIGYQTTRAVFLVALSLSGLTPAIAQVSLGTAQNFAVLGASTVTNTGVTAVNGDLGVSPGLAVTGFPPGIVTGVIHVGDAVALQAQADANTAYNDFAGLACNMNLTGQDLGGMTLVPGVYCFSSSAQLTGTLVLDSLGDPNSVFVFQIGSTLTTASNAAVMVVNGGNLCNVFWQVGSSATLGTDTTFVGNILALASITLNTRVELDGRAIALNGAVTMDSNRVTLSQECRCTVFGTIEDLGGGCGVPNIPLLVSTRFVVGQSLILSIMSMHPNAMVALFISDCGAAPWIVPGTTCEVFLDPMSLLTLLTDMTDATGSWTFTYALPLDQILVGRCFVIQGLVWAQGGPLAGDHLTNALRVTIGCM